MSNLMTQIYDLLSQEFEFDKAKVFEFGWCNIIEAEDRLYKRPVRIYVPREDAWENSAAKKILKAQFKAYFKAPMHECLPEAIELIEGKNAKGCIILVTRRSGEPNLMSGERQGEETSWLRNDTYSLPQKLGATRKLTEAMKILHGFGMVHGALGHQTISVERASKGVRLRISLLNFGDVTSTEPAPALFFEPAFTAPELFEGGASNEEYVKSTTTDVYSLAKFMIYFLLGPEQFVKFFTQEDKVSEPAKTIAPKLSDHVLWTNIAHQNSELESSQLERLSNDKLSSEIAEFLNYAVSTRPDTRPEDAQMFFHGLTTIMSGELDAGPEAMEMHAGMGASPAQLGRQASNVNLPLIGGIAAAVLLLLGGGYFLLKNRAEQASLNAQMAATKQSCGGFMGSVASLKESRITGLEQWADIEFLQTRINQNGQAPDKLKQTQEYCDNGNSKLSSLRAALIAGFKSDVDTALELQGEERTDFADLNIDAMREEANAAEGRRDFAGTEKFLGGLADNIRARRGVALNIMLDNALSENEAARDLLGLQDPVSVERTILSRAEGALSLDDTAASIEKKRTAIADIRTFDLSRLKKTATKRISDLGGIAETLSSEDAEDAGLGFDKMVKSLEEMQKSELPETIEDYGLFFSQLDLITKNFTGAKDHMEKLAIEVPRLTQNIDRTLEVAERNKWDQEANVAVLAAQFRNRESFSIFKDWNFLSKIDRSLTDEVSVLEKQWAEGKSVCTALLANVDQTNGIETTLIWPELSDIISSVRSLNPDEIGRDSFNQCTKGYALAKRGAFEIQSRELVEEIMTTKASLEDDGIGSFVPEYTEGVNGLEALKGLNLPQNQTSYDTYSQKAYAVLDSLDGAREVVKKAKAENKALMEAYLALNAEIVATPLGKHPEYERVFSGLSVAQSANIIEQNAAVILNTETLEELFRKFKAGDLINCSFGEGYDMLPILLEGEEFATGNSLIEQAATNLGIAVKLQAGDISNFCISPKPVTKAELDAFGKTLRVKQTDIKTEIGNAKEGVDGGATNISFWLAKRYAAWVGKKIDKPVCVAPAIAAVLAHSKAPDRATTYATGELFAESCGSQSSVGKKLAITGIGSSSLVTSCVSNNSLRPKLAFRLAAGDICRDGT